MNHLKPAEILQALTESGVAKANSGAMRLIIMGIMAGAYIAFAGAASNMAAFNLLASPDTYGLGRILSGTIFTGGLMMVVLAGAELFTGNSLMTVSVLEKKITVPKMLRCWVIVYLANLAGSVLVAWLSVNSGMLSSGDGMLGAVTVQIAAGKVNKSFISCLISDICCNWLVCLAVWMSTGGRSTADKAVAIFFPIWLFVTSGFEHCVANMYFIPAGIFAAADEGFASASGVSGAALENLDWGGMMINNLLPVTIGNLIGGVVFVAMGYWLALRKFSREKSYGMPER